MILLGVINNSNKITKHRSAFYLIKRKEQKMKLDFNTWKEIINRLMPEGKSLSDEIIKKIAAIYAAKEVTE